jgi:hypothetical protein
MKKQTKDNRVYVRVSELTKKEVKKKKLKFSYVFECGLRFLGIKIK